MNPVSPHTLLDVSDLSFQFQQGQPIFTDVSLHLNQGEIVSIVGPSGCGKSTLLSVISQLREHTSGTIERNYSNVQMVFQDSALLPWRTVKGNVVLTQQLQTCADRAHTFNLDADTALAAVGLTNDGDKYPHQLSGGMKMRASLARALVGGADVLLCDEPFSSIDELTRELLNDLLLSLQRQHQFGTLFVTHNVSEAVYLSDRVLVMKPVNGVSRITKEIVVSLSQHRAPRTRFQQEFHRVVQQVHDALRGNSP